MEASDFHAMILDDPADDLPRQIFADWLEETGRAHRADWIRACCDRARLPAGSAEHAEAGGRVRDLWRHAQPTWWPLVPGAGVASSMERGLLRLVVKNRNMAARLADLPWLASAVADGWISWITIERVNNHTARTVARWGQVPRAVPVDLNLNPWIDQTGVMTFLGLPNLWRLHLPHWALVESTTDWLGSADRLRDLCLTLDDHDRDRSRAALAAVGRLVGLRRLELVGAGGIEDADLASFAHLPSLRQLNLRAGPDLPAAALDRLRASRPDLQVLVTHHRFTIEG